MATEQTLETTEAVAEKSAPVSETVVKVTDLSHQYPKTERPALKSLSFEVFKGEIFGLLGPNGGGKTTLFRILSTYFKPSAGQASIANFSVLEQAGDVRRNIGVVFQSPSLDKKLTVFENLKHQGHLYGMFGSVLNERIATMLDRVGLTDKANDDVETLSGGQQRRVEVAKGMLHKPSILILDEPSTGLDPGARIDLWTYLAQLSRDEQITILVTTHLMEEAERCDRLLILNRGERVALGSPDELRKEIGGEVLSLKSKQLDELESWLKDNRPELTVKKVEAALRIETEEGLKLAQGLRADCPIHVDSLSIGRPTLEDVFIKKTGHRFWHELDQA